MLYEEMADNDAGGAVPSFGGRVPKKSVKILHCDRCGREVEFDADSNMTEDWIIVCKECRKDMD